MRGAPVGSVKATMSAEPLCLWDSDVPAIYDETGTLRQGVVEPDSRHVGLLRLPVATGRAIDSVPFPNSFDQCAPNSLTPCSLMRKQILHIAGGLKQDGAAVKQIVYESQ